MRRPLSSIVRLPAAPGLVACLPLLLGSSCDVLIVSDPCGLAVAIRTSHSEVDLRVGQSQTVSMAASACGERVDVRAAWNSQDPTVARVDRRSGEITGVTVGEVVVVGEDRGSSDAGSVEILVRVHE